MSDAAVIDTTVLWKANGLLESAPKPTSTFGRCASLLRRVQRRELVLLISAKLRDEYQRKLTQPRNILIAELLAIVASPDGLRAVENWAPGWSGGTRDAMRKCRFPRHDEHLLRTAVKTMRDDNYTKRSIFTQEAKLIATDACIHRNFSVHIVQP